MSEITSKLNKLSKNKSSWINDANDRGKNSAWLKHSQRIALKVLITLREKNVSKEELSKINGITLEQISKIVKGKENLTLETISKLEEALKINLIFETKL